MASHAVIIQIGNSHLKRLIHLFICVLISYSQTGTMTSLPPCWQKLEKIKHFGLFNTYDTTLEGCIHTCQHVFRDCQIISFRREESWPCWANDGVFNESKYEENELVDSYKLDGECLISNCWEKIAGKHYEGLHGIYDKSVFACIQSCLYKYRGCIYISFIHGNANPCSVDVTDMESEPEMRNEAGANSYKLNKNCMTTTQKSLTTPTTSAIPPCWQKMENTKYYGLYNNYETTVAGCIHICQNVIRDCEIISYRRNERWPCWANDAVFEKSKYAESELVDSYILDGECLMNNCWEKIPGKYYVGLTSIYDKSLFACFQSCLNKYMGCLYMSFIHGTANPCSVDVANIELEPEMINEAGVDSYKLNQNCMTTTNGKRKTTGNGKETGNETVRHIPSKAILLKGLSTLHCCIFLLHLLAEPLLNACALHKDGSSNIFLHNEKRCKNKKLIPQLKKV